MLYVHSLAINRYSILAPPRRKELRKRERRCRPPRRVPQKQAITTNLIAEGKGGEEEDLKGGCWLG